ncbi:hypothetical protein ACT4Z3_07330 [Acinetobacter baumannii]
MNDIFWNSSVGLATDEIYIPNGSGPFPAILIFDTGLKKSTKNYATFYAKKMKEIGFFSSLVTLNVNQFNNFKSNEIGSAIDYILNRKDVNKNKIYLIEIEKNNLLDSNIKIYKKYFHAVASVNYFNLNS